MRRDEGYARAVHHPGTARREDRHHSVQRRNGSVSEESAEPGESKPRADYRPGSSQARSHSGGLATLAGDWEEGTERSPGEQVDWLGHRYQERRREAPRNRRPDDRFDRTGHAAELVGGGGREDHRENGSCG